MFAGQGVNLALVCLVQVLDSVKELLLAAAEMLFELLNLLLELVRLRDELLLVAAVVVGVLAQLYTRRRDVRLQLVALALRVGNQLLVEGYILLQIVDDLLI